MQFPARNSIMETATCHWRTSDPTLKRPSINLEQSVNNWNGFRFAVPQNLPFTLPPHEYRGSVTVSMTRKHAEFGRFRMTSDYIAVYWKLKCLEYSHGMNAAVISGGGITLKLLHGSRIDINSSLPAFPSDIISRTLHCVHQPRSFQFLLRAMHSIWEMWISLSTLPSTRKWLSFLVWGGDSLGPASWTT